MRALVGRGFRRCCEHKARSSLKLKNEVRSEMSNLEATFHRCQACGGPFRSPKARDRFCYRCRREMSEHAEKIRNASSEDEARTLTTCPHVGCEWAGNTGRFKTTSRSPDEVACRLVVHLHQGHSSSSFAPRPSRRNPNRVNRGHWQYFYDPQTGMICQVSPPVAPDNCGCDVCWPRIIKPKRGRYLARRPKPYPVGRGFLTEYIPFARFNFQPGTTTTIDLLTRQVEHN